MHVYLGLQGLWCAEGGLGCGPEVYLARATSHGQRGARPISKHVDRECTAGRDWRRVNGRRYSAEFYSVSVKNGVDFPSSVVWFGDETFWEVLLRCIFCIKLTENNKQMIRCSEEGLAARSVLQTTHNGHAFKFSCRKDRVLDCPTYVKGLRFCCCAFWSARLWSLRRTSDAPTKVYKKIAILAELVKLT